MALIPITFKADGGDTAPKKGKVRAEDISTLFAFCLGQDTGVLSVLNKCAYYDIVNSSGQAVVYFHNGYVSVCGRLIYVEEGTSCAVTLPTSGSEAGSFGIRVSLANTGTAEVNWYMKKSSDALQQDDLTENPISGVYEFELYRYTANISGLTLSRSAKVVKPMTELFAELKDTVKKQSAQGAIYPADLGGTVDTTNGTILARLNSLGFSEGNVTISYTNGGITQQSIVKQGKIARLNIVFALRTAIFNVGDVIGTVPSYYSAKEPTYFTAVTTGGATVPGSMEGETTMAQLLRVKIEGTTISVDNVYARYYSGNYDYNNDSQFILLNGAYEVA